MVVEHRLSGTIRRGPKHFRRRGLLIAAALIGLWPGCSSPPPAPYTAESNLRLTPEEGTEKRILDAADQRRALAAMKSVAAGYRSENPPVPAPHGVRWADVPEAVRDACGVEGVEMAVVSEREYDWGYRYQLYTIDERPAVLIVRRVPGRKVYEAEATVGRFHDDQARAGALLDAFDAQMRRQGALPKFNQEE